MAEFSNSHFIGYVFLLVGLLSSRADITRLLINLTAILYWVAAVFVYGVTFGPSEAVLLIVTACFSLKTIVDINSASPQGIQEVYKDTCLLLLSILLLQTTSLLFVILYMLILEVARNWESFGENRLNYTQIFLLTMLGLFYFSATGNFHLTGGLEVEKGLATFVGSLCMLIIMQRFFATPEVDFSNLSDIFQKLVHYVVSPLVLVKIIDNIGVDFVMFENFAISSSIIFIGYFIWEIWNLRKVIECLVAINSILFINLYLFFDSFNFEFLSLSLVLLVLIASSWKMSQGRGKVNSLYKIILLPSPVSPILWTILQLMTNNRDSLSYYLITFLIFYIGILALLFPRIETTRYNGSEKLNQFEYGFSILLIIITLISPLLRMN